MNDYMEKYFLFLIMFFLFPIVLVAQYAGRYPRYEHTNDTSESNVKLCCERLLSNEYHDKWDVYYDSLGYGGYVDKSKEVTIQNNFCKVYNFNKENTAWVQNCQDKKYYLINRSGSFITKGYDYFRNDFEGFHSVAYIVGEMYDGKLKLGVINSKGEIIVPIIYERVLSSMSECYELFVCCKAFKCFKKSKWSIFNSYGQIVVPPCNSNYCNSIALGFDEVKDGIFIGKIGHKRYIFNANDSARRVKGCYIFEKLYKSTFLIVYKTKGNRTMFGALDLLGNECVPCISKTIDDVIKILDNFGKNE